MICVLDSAMDGRLGNQKIKPAKLDDVGQNFNLINFNLKNFNI